MKTSPLTFSPALSGWLEWRKHTKLKPENPGFELAQRFREERGWLIPWLVAWSQELWSVCECSFGLCSSYCAWASYLWAMLYKRGCVDLVLPKGRAVCLHCLCHRLLLSQQPLKPWLQTREIHPDECAHQLIVNSFSPSVSLCKNGAHASSSNHQKRNIYNCSTIHWVCAHHKFWPMSYIFCRFHSIYIQHLVHSTLSLKKEDISPGLLMFYCSYH